MPDRLIDDTTIPPPGSRHGEGCASILPYLVRTLASKPMAPASAPGPQPDPGSRGEAPPHQSPGQ